jgi:aerobactin synthase
MERICLNKARFKTGYADNAERPEPALGPRLANPLHAQPTEYPFIGVLS